MRKCAKCLLVLLVVNFFAAAQVIPQSGAKLNYTQVMFEYEKIKGAEVYLLQIVEDTTGPLFEKPLIEQKDSSTATLISNLQFGKKYLWRYTGITKGGQLPWKGPYNFETGDINSTGRNSFVATILKNDTSKHAGGLIAFDYYTIINRKGEPVWYWPEIKGRNQPLPSIRDTRLTPFNTLTFLIGIGSGGAAAYECDLEGNVLWQAPDDGKISGDTTEYYHHDFQRLPTGNYMILGDKFVWRKVPSHYLQQLQPENSPLTMVPDPNTGLNPAMDALLSNYPFLRQKDGEIQAKIQFGTIIEYNKKGEIVWSWDSETYLTEEEVFPLLFFSNTTLAQGKPPMANDRDAHMNAFSVDAENKFVYAGFRQLSKVIKIEKQTGKVVNTWDKTTLDPEALFYYQHSATIRGDGSILVFDNDPRIENKASRVLALTPPTPESPGKVALSFDCIFDSVAVKGDRGGNADELPNKNILASMGVGLSEGGIATSSATGAKSRIFEITPDEQLVWSATIEKILQPPYRAHYTSSLYPYYFTVQTDGESYHDKFDLTVFNEGSESDSYTISISSAGKGIIKQFSSPVLQSGKSKRVEIKLDKLPKADEELEIVVQSTTNLDFERKLVMQFSK